MRWTLGELAYARGMATISVQDSMDALTTAGEWWPYGYKMRTASALQLAALSGRVPSLSEYSIVALNAALTVDRNSIDLLSALVVVCRRVGDCENEKLMTNRLMVLVRRVAVGYDCHIER